MQTSALRPLTPILDLGPHRGYMLLFSSPILLHAYSALKREEIAVLVSVAKVPPHPYVNHVKHSRLL